MIDTNVDEVFRIVREMLSIEQSICPNWEMANELASKGIVLLIKLKLELDPYILKFFDDIDIRQKDYEYARYQYKKVSYLLDERV